MALLLEDDHNNEYESNRKEDIGDRHPLEPQVFTIISATPFVQSSFVI